MLNGRRHTGRNTGRESAIDDITCAGDVAGLIAEQERGNMGDLRRSGITAQGNQCVERSTRRLRVRSADIFFDDLHHLRVHQTRM